MRLRPQIGYLAGGIDDDEHEEEEAAGTIDDLE